MSLIHLFHRILLTHWDCPLTFRLPLTMSIGELKLTEKVLEMVKVKGISGEGDTAHGEHLKAEAEDTF
ncbi:hypothetical protein ABER23_28165 [Paenibacillus lautus]|uniref:hypothetical protein n=1 Tax=Paenibacillus lautus TaxID=1401 RepID=UPI003D2C8D09